MRHRAFHLGFVGGSRLGLLCLSPNGSGFQRRPVEINRDSEDGYFMRYLTRHGRLCMRRDAVHPRVRVKAGLQSDKGGAR